MNFCKKKSPCVIFFGKGWPIQLIRTSGSRSLAKEIVALDQALCNRMANPDDPWILDIDLKHLQKNYAQNRPLGKRPASRYLKSKLKIQNASFLHFVPFAGCEAWAVEVWELPAATLGGLTPHSQTDDKSPCATTASTALHRVSRAKTCRRRQQ